MSPGIFAALVTAAIVMGGAAVLALAYLVVQAHESSRVKRRLNPGGVQAGGHSESHGGAVLRALADRGRKIEALIDTENESQRLLMQAGWRAPRDRTIYYAAQVMTPAVLVLLVGLLWVSGPEKLSQPAIIFVMALIAVMLGVLLPKFVLRSVATSRVRRIKGEVPLFVHLLVLLFEAGLSTRQAFASMVRDGRGVLPELGKEFELVLRQLEAGADTFEILKNVEAGLDLEDLTNVLALLRQVDRYGGEVREPLLENLKMLEDRRSMDMREMVNLISGRMTIVMVLFFFPALLIFVAGPAFLAVINALGSVK